MMGKGWNLTPKRREEAVRRLFEQDTVKAIALDWKIHHNTLREKLKEAGINPREVRNAGRVSLRKGLFQAINSIEDDETRVKLGLQYLDRYKVIDDDEVEQDGGSDVDAITAKILIEMNGGNDAV